MGPFDDLLRSLGLGPDLPDPQRARAVLRGERDRLHPDKTGGKFPSPEAEERFHRVMEALNWLDGQVPALVSQGSELARLDRIEQSLAELQSRDRVGEQARHSKREYEKEVRSAVAAPYRQSTLRSGIFAAVVVGIVTFSRTLPTNPVFGWVARNAVARTSLWVAALCSGLLFCVYSVKEARARKLVGWLLSEGGLSRVVAGCLEESSRDGTEGVITRRCLAQGVLFSSRVWRGTTLVRALMEVLAPSIPTPIAEQIAGIHLEELQRRGLLRPAGFRGVEPMFRIDEERAREIVEDRFLYY